MKLLAIISRNQDSNRGLDGSQEVAAMHAIVRGCGSSATRGWEGG